MPDYGLSEYKQVMKEVLQLMKLRLGGQSYDGNMSESDHNRIVDAAPPGLKDYADSMARVHVFELEKIWRERNDRK